MLTSDNKATESFVTDRQTDGQADGQSHKSKTVYPFFKERVYKKNHNCYQSHVINYMNNYAPDPAKIHDVILVTNMRCCWL